jgi:hypothetical protein
MRAPANGTRLRAIVARAVAVAAAALPFTAAPAGAVILPATTIAGPSAEIVGFGGVAMAEDGSGGAAWLQRSGGVVHLFVSRYLAGQWSPAVRVDGEEPFAASWPQIGAFNGGGLIVTWATPYATSITTGRPVYQLLGCVLGAGAEGFGRAVLLDRDIEEAVGTDPDLAVSSTGQADVVYRVVKPTTAGVALLRRGDVAETVKVAHFDGLRWTNLGSINRDPAIGMRPPTKANAPVIAIGPTGSGTVVWQEPELEGVARLWGRRIFGSELDYAMPVSATSYRGHPINDDAEAPAVSFSRLGQAEVVYRQPAGSSSPLPGPRIFLNVLPDGESVNGGEFTGATVLDEAVAGGKSAFVGTPSIDIDEARQMRSLYDDNGTPRLIEANDRGQLLPPLSLSPAFAGPEPVAASVMNPEGGGVSAWPSHDAAGDPEVAVLENFPAGGAQTGLVAGGAGGEVSELSVGRSGLGDGLVGFRQGPFGNAAIVVSSVTAPPATLPFVLTLPKTWVRPAQALASWLPAVSGAGPLTYHVVVDGHPQPTPGGVLAARIDTRGLRSGVHRVQVMATDRDGQSSLSAPAQLLLDDTPPSVQIRRARGASAVSITVRDRFSGLARQSVRVSFGDGSAAAGRARFAHSYAHAGVYLVTVSSTDKLGLAGVTRQWVSVR